MGVHKGVSREPEVLLSFWKAGVAVSWSRAGIVLEHYRTPVLKVRFAESRENRRQGV